SSGTLVVACHGCCPGRRHDAYADSCAASGVRGLMPRSLTPLQYSILEAVCARLVPADDAPDGTEMGAVDYIDMLLGAFTFTPPRIWAGGPFSGRFGGNSSFSDFEKLSPAEELAWRTRIEGSRGIPERERLGPVTGLQETYTKGLAELGEEFLALDPAARD